MSDTMESLRRNINRAGDLQSVVRTMKALATSSIGQYEKAVSALDDYYRTVELGLSVCFRDSIPDIFYSGLEKQKKAILIGAIVFGSDQGLVGQFNDVIADYAVKILPGLPGKAQVLSVGERVHARLVDTDLQIMGLYTLPNSIKAITPLVKQILLKIETIHSQSKVSEIHIFYNLHKSRTLYEPTSQLLLPLDKIWRQELAELPWPTKNLPEIIGDNILTLQALIHEYLFVSLFRACAESLASENASRLAAMQHAEKNINEMLEELKGKYYRLRQNSIDEELFEVFSGFEALSHSRNSAQYESNIYKN
jgi:F-type H+-transporting ATPase subunit gamma